MILNCLRCRGEGYIQGAVCPDCQGTGQPGPLDYFVVYGTIGIIFLLLLVGLILLPVVFPHQTDQIFYWIFSLGN